MSFVHLNVHTEYSLLGSTVQIKELIKKSSEYNMSSVAMTDQGNMFGAIEFYVKAKKQGIKPILGADVFYCQDRFSVPELKNYSRLKSQDELEAKLGIYHATILCKSNKGYENLCQILSKAYLEGLHHKPRADVSLFEEFKEDLIFLSGGAKAEAGALLLDGQDDKAKASLKKMKDLFGENFFLEVHRHGRSEEDKINNELISIAKDLSIPLVATNEVYYLNKENAKAHEVLVCVGAKKTLSDEERIVLEGEQNYFKNDEQMRELFKDLPEAISHTENIAEMCNVDLKWKDENGNQIYHLPKFDINTDESEDEFFRRKSLEGLEERFAGPHFIKIVKEQNWESEHKPQYLARLKEELDMICDMGFTGYFLIVADFIQWAKEKDIPVGPGRGSGAGSIVAYALKITNINPIPYNLLFERFINPERISMPDFDVDFCQQRRGEVINYVTEKYNTERVGQIVTFGKLLAKAAIRDVSRVLGLPYSEADMLSKLVPEELGITLDEALEQEPKFNELMDTDPKIKKVINYSRQVEGLSRHASIHAAGVIITSEPLVKYCPLLTGANEERVIQFDKNWSEEIGLVKFDFLGLKTLTVISYATEHIRKSSDPHFDIENIDLEDSDVYKYIAEGETTGVFQLESSGMIDLCKRIHPDSIEDITAINALYRPGPMGSGMVDDFVEIKNGRKEISYPFQELEGVLKDTLGVIVYQEQVMNIARLVAGYSLGQADMLRRAMGKKKREEMDRHREIFRKGAIEKGFDEKKAIELFDAMAKFAEYGFNKSHAVAYAFIAYQTAYLKYYYPSCFYAGLLSTELNNADKITLYINDCRKNNIEVLPPDVNESIWLFNVSNGKLRFAMGAIKNVGAPAVKEIVREREENGPFKGFVDFCERVDLRIVNKRSVESLIKVGAFDTCERLTRKSLMNSMEKVMIHGNKVSEEKRLGQGNLFGLAKESSEKFLELEEFREFDDKEKLGYEFQLLGIYVSGHPLDQYADDLKKLGTMNISRAYELEPLKNMGPSKERKWDNGAKRDVVLGGLLSGTKTILTKKGDKMAFTNLEDLTGKIECVVFPKVFTEYEEFLHTDEPVIIEGQINTKEEPKKLFPTKITRLRDEREEKITGVRISLDIEKIAPEMINKLKTTLEDFQGSTPAHIIFQSEKGRARLPLGKEFFIDPTPQLANKVNDIFNEKCVRFIINGEV